MTRTAKTKAKTTTERLLEGLIADCQVAIQDDILPMARAAERYDKMPFLHSVTQMMDCAVRLGDAVGRLRCTAPQPEFRQRITVEKILALPAPKAGG